MVQCSLSEIEGGRSSDVSFRAVCEIGHRYSDRCVEKEDKDMRTPQNFDDEQCPGHDQSKHVEEIIRHKVCQSTARVLKEHVQHVACRAGAETWYSAVPWVPTTGREPLQHTLGERGYSQRRSNPGNRKGENFKRHGSEQLCKANGGSLYWRRCS